MAEQLTSPTVLSGEPAPTTDTHAPAGQTCPECGAPHDADDRFCPACGFTLEPQNGETVDIAPVRRHLQCQTCGAAVATDTTQRSYTCPFCDSNYVVEYSPDETGREPPEFVIGFTVTPQQALEKYHQWISERQWFRPGDLTTAQIEEKLRGIYLPFWTFSMLAESAWSASIGEHWYRTEQYTTMVNGKPQVQTRTVTETEWWPLEGRHHRFYSQYLVSGSKGLPQTDADRVQPFYLAGLKRYRSDYLAGWLAEEYSIDSREAEAICRAEFLRREHQNVAAFLPGDKHRNLDVQTQLSQTSSSLALLPVYILSYRYRDRLYRFLVNGQTGHVSGDKPVSAARITAAVVIGVAIMAAWFGLIWLFANR